MERWKEHRRRLKNNTHENIFLQRAYNKYGKESFKYIIYEVIQDESELIEAEQYWIDNLKSTNKKYGYNINPIAGKPPSRIGYKHKKETIEKIRKTNTGQKRSCKSKEKMRKAHLGKSNYLKAKKIINIDTLEKFDRIKDAAKYYNIHYGNICLACNGKRIKAGGYKWMYLEDYNKINGEY